MDKAMSNKSGAHFRRVSKGYQAAKDTRAASRIEARVSTALTVWVKANYPERIVEIYELKDAIRENPDIRLDDMGKPALLSNQGE